MAINTDLPLNRNNVFIQKLESYLEAEEIGKKYIVFSVRLRNFKFDPDTKLADVVPITKTDFKNARSAAGVPGRKDFVRIFATNSLELAVDKCNEWAKSDSGAPKIEKGLRGLLKTGKQE